MHEQCEVAVVGAGPGGMRAALAAAKAGVQVTLIDANRQPGGQYYRQADLSGAPDEHGHQAKGRKLWQEVQAAGVTYLPETVVWGIVGERTLALHGPDAPAFVDAQAIILSTGAYDRPVAFPGWTLPGVMTAGAAQTLLKTQGILAGRRIVLAGTGPLQFVLAAELRHAGAEIVAILEGSHNLKPSVSQVGALWKQWGRLGEGLRSLADLTRHGVPIHMGWGIVSAHPGGAGDESVGSIAAGPLDENWRPKPDQVQNLTCDTLLLGYGFIPANSLSVLMGADQVWRPDLGGQVPVRDEMMQTSLPGVYAVGDGAGIGGVLLAEVEGEIAGLAAAGRIQGQAARAAQAIRKLGKELERERRFQTMYAELFTPEPGLYDLAQTDTILCRCEEVTLGQVQDAVALGQTTTNEVKMVTRCGMGECQGRMCGQLVARAVAKAAGKTVAQVGLLLPRPPLFPIPIADLAQIYAQDMADVGSASGRKEDRI